MTVLSKSGASTDSPSGENSSSYPSDDKRPYPNEPPSYTDSVGGHNIQSSGTSNVANPTSPASTSAAPLPPPTNYTNENRGNGAIRGTWVIDTNIEVPPPPPSLWSSLGWAPKERPNLELTTGNGVIYANIILVSGSSQRAFIKANTSNGAVKIKIASRVNNQPIKLVASTRVGAIKVGLPRSFVGPYKFQTGCGNIKYSDALRANANRYSPSTGFIGDWSKAGFVDHSTWNGDVLEVQTNVGEISFYYADEIPDHMECGPNVFWKTLTGFFGPHQ